MHLINALSLLTALAAASPINSPRNPDSAPVAINKRFEASVPWIWRPRKTDFEQFEDNEATNNGADTADAATNKVKRFEASVPWIWRPRKADFEQFEDGNDEITPTEANSDANAVINKRFEASVPWIWRPRKTDFEQFEDGAGDAAGNATGENAPAGEGAEGEEK